MINISTCNYGTHTAVHIRSGRRDLQLVMYSGQTVEECLAMHSRDLRRHASRIIAQTEFIERAQAQMKEKAHA
ncbi:hypothetical protein [Simplicispira suum]|uniref:Uncharacterized protein n=1 Tax=Simplicispira suum TaxID=2109915 RepID=A0A2S0N5Q4_9BURK|nr:hypothetical protein [Simplicispira suum]AVO43478.1 hypothetical protein C6571_18820 [Simplicispira suum]